LQISTIVNAKIYNVLSEIQAKLEPTGVVPVMDSRAAQGEAAATVKEISEILQSWIERLPLMEVKNYLDFNDMLRDHPSVANEIVIISIHLQVLRVINQSLFRQSS
jgi:hypothetical protein